MFVHYFLGSLSSPHTLIQVLFLLVLDCPSTPYWEFGLTPPKDCIIVRYFESDLLLFSCLPPILSILIICRVVLLLILKILVRSCWDTIFDIVYPLWIWKNFGLWNKKYVKIMSSNLLWTWSSYFLFFLLR